MSNIIIFNKVAEETSSFLKFSYKVTLFYREVTKYYLLQIVNTKKMVIQVFLKRKIKSWV